MIEIITSGESHGKGMIATVSGVPAGLPFDEDAINHELARRQVGYGRGGRMKIEKDKIDVIAGVRSGKTTGAPITLAVWNKDWENWKGSNPEPIHKARPGHADLIGAYKYEHRDDMRHILERSSARETAARVAGSAIARLFLRQFGIDIFSHVVKWGGIVVDTSKLTFNSIKEKAEASDIRSACDPETEKAIKKRIDQYQSEGDTMGGIIEIICRPIPPFLGSYQTARQKLDANLARTALSVQAIKGVEFGLGFRYAETRGSEAHDQIYFDDQQKKYYRKTNNAGGIEGGMTNGKALVFRAVMKPIPTLMSPLDTVNIHSKKAEIAIKERSDVTAVAAAGVVLENASAIDIMNAFMERYGRDNMDSIRRHFESDSGLEEFRWKE